jgi:AmmeMemoRadiSam system protein B
MKRKAVAEGTFYEGKEEELKEQIRNCFLHRMGPGEIPSVKKGRGKIKACIVPHAGYMYSGHIAAHVYNAIALDGFPDVCVILGPNHTGYGSSIAVMTEGEWETPLGNVPIHTHTAKTLQKGIVEHDEIAHLYEHSIEVQLPFLQFFNPSISFVPLSIRLQDYNSAKDIADTLSEINILFIASTDFSHVGLAYGHAPPHNIPSHQWAAEQDKRAIDAILALDARRVIEVVKRHSISMCGYGCVAAVMLAAKKAGAKEASLLSYATSYDVHPSDSCVGYAAIVIK